MKEQERNIKGLNIYDYTHPCNTALEKQSGKYMAGL